MAKPRIFVSSTCYDLTILRAELRPFILQLGYEPVMSENSDILFDPRSHTHESCVGEIPKCDAVVLIIGPRFGGTIVPSVLQSIDSEKLSKASQKPGFVTELDRASITQLEALKAVEVGLPVYTFVDSKVLHDQHVYETNKDNTAVIGGMKFPSIQKQETAKYIFEFINYMSHRSVNNAICPFENLEDIRAHLASQWAQLFQRLLYESRTKQVEAQRYRDFSEQLEDLKAVVLASIATPDLKQLAQAVIKYRQVVTCFGGVVGHDIRSLLLSDVNWDQLLRNIGVEKIIEGDGAAPHFNRLFLVLGDGTFYQCRCHMRMFDRIAQEWERFRIIEKGNREAIVDAIMDNRNMHLSSPLRYHDMQLLKYLDEQEDQSDGDSNSDDGE